MNEFQELALVKGNTKVSFCSLNEGFEGDYNPDDPDDVSLLRFDVSVWNDENYSYDQPQDASYCTLLSVDTDEETLIKLLRVILSEVYEPLQDGHSIKRICERLSWIDEEGVY